MDKARTGRFEPAGWVTIVALAAALVAAAPARAQVMVFPRQPLTFGTLLPGTPVSVPPTNVTRRAELELIGSGNVTVTVAVPAVLVRAGGGTLPLSYSATDGIYKRFKASGETYFQPGTTFSFNIPSGQGGAWVWIGGRASPAPTQIPGTYTGIITVTVITVGT